MANGSKVGDTPVMMLCALLPEVPRLNLQVFHDCDKIFKGTSEKDQRVRIARILKKLLPRRNEKSKCVIVLAEYNSYKFMHKILNELRQK